MNNSRIFLFSAFAVAMIMGLVGFSVASAFSQAAPSQSQQEGNKRAEQEALRAVGLAGTEKCFSSGSGPTFLKVCITNRGNISHFESPAGRNHLFTREGYVVCAFNNQLQVHGFDAGSAEGGWAAPSVSQPNGPGKLPLIVKRNSLDKKVQLTQTFTIIAADRAVQVVMAVKNISTSNLPFEIVDRYFDADLDGSGANDRFDQSDDSVWGVNGSQHTGNEPNSGLMLTQVNSSAFVTVLPHIQSFESWNPNGSGQQQARSCAGSVFSTPTSALDGVAGSQRRWAS